MDKMLLLRAIVQGMDCLLRLNGLVIAKLRAGIELCLPVHEYIQAGTNRLQLVGLGTSNGPACTGLATVNCSFKASLEIRKDRGAMNLVQGTVLYRVSGDLAQGDSLKDGLVLDSILELPLAFPKWCFMDFMQTECCTGDIPRAEAFMVELIRCLQTASLPELLRVFSVRNREVATAYQLDTQQHQVDFRAHLHEICTRAVICDSTLDPANWRFHPVGQSALYAVLDRGFDPLLKFRFADTGHHLLIPMHVGVLGGEVFLLR